MTVLRPAERLLLAYFAYTVGVSAVLGGFAWRVVAIAAAAGALIWILTAISPRSAVRDWAPLALVPVAYWQMDFIRRPDAAAGFARRWLPVDEWFFRHAHPESWARRSFRIRLVVANAHDGSVPPNQYNADAGTAVTPPLTILVERGSHAMAPDINHDGRFTPSIDSTAPGKLMWGIRDGGDAWGWYRASYMDRRDNTAVRLCEDTTASAGGRCEPYALYPVTDLQRWFEGLQLSNRERLDIVGHTAWVTRVFGDVRVENLMVLADPPDGHMLDRMLTRRTRTQEGYEAGFTMLGKAPAGIAGKRFFWDVPSQRMPDVVADVSAIVPAGKPSRLQAIVTGSYALDATTNVLLGGGWFSVAGSHPDGVVGVDVRVGRFHVQPMYRLGHDWVHANLVALF